MLKNKKNKTRWIPVLMIISQLLLTGFVIQWLINQYKNEESILKEQVHREFFESIGQVMDSMLYERIIDPILQDSSNVYRQPLLSRASKLTIDSVYGNHLTRIYKNNAPEGQAVISVHLSDSTLTDSSGTAIMAIDGGINKEFLLHSFRLIINQTSDSSFMNNQMMKVFAGEPDTIILKQILSERLNEKGLMFPLIWFCDTDSSFPHAGGSEMFFESGIHDNGFGFEIEKYRSYLLGQIFPQILFVIVLLLLTSAAFFFTYRSLEKQIALNNLRKDFISNISHELKTPVSTVKVALEALKKYDMKKDPKLSDEYLLMASKEMERLDELVSKVLNTSILDNGEGIISREPTDLKSLVEEVMKRMDFRFNTEKANVYLESDDKDYNLNIDRLYIQGVLINLLDNSLKYSQGNSEIKIELKQSKSNIFLIVNDNGPGIPPKYIKKVFEKFFRVPENNKHNVKGYGLGLSFVELVMKQHNGLIELRNLPEGGCSFKLIFPKTES